MSVLRSTCVLGRLASSSLRQSVFSSPALQIRCVTLKATKVQPKQDLGHDERNMKIGRPLSPHLTIYAPQLTSMMSISHRIAGMALSGYAIILASASFCPYDVASMAQWIHDTFPSALLFVSKIILGFPVAYHLCNGVRHLIWDAGKALTLKQVYTGGYATIAASALVTLWMVL